MKKKYVRMANGPILSALRDIVAVIRGHMDFEGTAIIKIERTGKQACFAMDLTARKLLDCEGGKGYDVQRLKDWTENPAMGKNWKK